MKDIIKTILYEWKERKLPIVIERDKDISFYLSMQPPKIVAITGFRRVGKTYFLFQIIQELLKSASKEDVLYINFEDERIPGKTEFLTQLLPTIKEVFHKNPAYLFLDEIQNIPEWSKWLRRIHDQENIRIFVTGSSSKLSNYEIPTELRGRCMEVTFFPLTFKEFLRFNEVEIDYEALPYSENQKALIARLLREYLTYGGLPEVALIGEEKKRELLQQYYATVLRKDVIERFRIKNEEGFKALTRLLLNSTMFSISGLYKTLRSIQYKIGATTVQRYLEYLATSYFLHPVSVFSWTIKDELQYPRKAYIVDNGFITTLSTKFGGNLGRLYENLVCIELKRREKGEIFYWKDQQKKEVDFVVKDEDGVRQLIQVCYDVQDAEVYKRETRALIAAQKKLRCDNLMIINNDIDRKEEIMYRRDHYKITFISLARWLLI